MTGSRKAIALLMVLLTVLLLFAGCKKEEGEPEGNVSVTGGDGQVISINRDSVFKLPCTRGDSFNPFYAEMLNNQTLMSLLYEPLFRLDEAFMAQPVIAEDCTVDGTSLTVPVRSDAKFSDGTAVSADDVVYSFEKAKNAPAYKANLAGISVAKQSGAATVVFTAAEANVNARQLLTFPVVKKGTGDTNTDVPMGSGRFVLKIEGASYQMTPNGFYTKTPAITKIELVNAESEEEIENALRIGNISFIYNDLSKGSKTSSNTKSQPVALNNLVYIGFNPSNIMGQSNALRQAVSFAINREQIVSGTYHSYATAATSIFNPLWKRGEGTDVASLSADNKAAEMALGTTEYKNAPLKLIVNEDNAYRRAAAEMIAKQLNAQGLNVTVNALAYDAYRQSMQAGSYDMFLGEVRLTNDMNLNCFFTAEGSCAFSVNLTDSKTAAAYTTYRNGTASVGDFMIAFKEEMPLVPVAYRKGLVAFTSQMKVKPNSVYEDVFRNIEEWTF